VAGDEEHGQGERRVSLARRAKLVVAAAALGILVAFAVQNSQRVAVDFVFFDRHPRLIVVIAVSALLGFVIGFALGRPNRRD
jgi:uncharacterized integral membrane protein